MADAKTLVCPNCGTKLVLVDELELQVVAVDPSVAVAKTDSTNAQDASVSPTATTDASASTSEDASKVGDGTEASA